MPAYVKTTWVNGSTEPISADNLNNIEGGIENAAAKDVANVFTDVQSATAVTEDNSVAFTSGNNIKIIATAANLTVTSQTINTSGTLVISSAENITGFGVEFDWGYQQAPTDLTGVETFGYFVSAASGVDSIKIGRV